MTKDQKNEVIEILKEKFNQYNNLCIVTGKQIGRAHV